MGERTLKQIVDAATADPAECGADCACLCHDEDVEDPGPHLTTCAWAAPDFPDYTASATPSRDATTR